MSRKTVLRICVITLFALILFPAAALLSIWADVSYGYAAALTGVFVVLMWAGAFFMLRFHDTYKKNPVLYRIILAVIMVTLWILGWLFAPYEQSVQRFLVGIVCALIFYAGNKLIYQPLESMTNAYVFTGLCIWCVFTGLLWQYFDDNITAWVSLLWLGVYAIIFAIANNTGALEQTLHDRDSHTWELPKEIRTRNRNLLLILGIVAVVVILCRKPIASFVSWVGKWIITGLWYLFSWISTLGGGTDEESTTPTVVEEQTEALEQSSGADWFWRIVEILILVILLALVIRYRKQISEFLSSCWVQFRHWLQEKIHKTPEDEKPDDSMGYCDYTEDLLEPETEAVQVRTNVSRRTWNRAYRKFLRMPMDAQGYRYGYGLALEKLPTEMTHPAASAGEILKRLEEAGLSDENWRVVTQGYNDVRYGEQQPQPEQFHCLQNLLAQQKEQPAAS